MSHTKVHYFRTNYLLYEIKIIYFGDVYIDILLQLTLENKIF